MHQFGWRSERGGQLFKFASERWGFQKVGGGGGIPSEKEGGWRKLGGNCEVKAVVIELQAKTKENEVSIEEILSFLQTKKPLKSETGNLFK